MGISKGVHRSYSTTYQQHGEKIRLQRARVKDRMHAIDWLWACCAQKTVAAINA